MTKNKSKKLLSELKKFKVKAILVLDYNKINNHKVFHSSAKLIASDSDIDESFKSLHQMWWRYEDGRRMCELNIMRLVWNSYSLKKVDKYVNLDIKWVVVPVVIKISNCIHIHLFNKKDTRSGKPKADDCEQNSE